MLISESTSPKLYRQAVETIIGPVLCSYTFFKRTGDSVSSLRNIQWVHLAIAIFIFCLAVMFYLVVIPEVTGRYMLYGLIYNILSSLYD